MSKPIIGLILGSVLGFLDGLSALFYPDAAPMIISIVIGSTIKGLITGAAAGFFARKIKSLPLGICIGLSVGLVLSYLAANRAHMATGNAHYFAIMLPGGILGMIVGFVTQKFGSVPESLGARQS